MSINNQVKMLIGFILGIGSMMLSNILNPPQYGIVYGLVDSYWPGVLAIMLMTAMMIETHATHHANLFARGKYIKHGVVNTVRVLLAFGLCSLVNAFAYNLMKVIDLTIFTMCWFGLVFSYRLNMKRRLPAFYLGRGRRASLIDKIFRRIKNGGVVLAVVEILIMILTAYLYCLK